MIYRAIGVMSGSSLDGLDIAFAEFQQNAGVWSYEIKCTDCFSYNNEWMQKLKKATILSALEYQLLHVEYGHYIGGQINKFIEKYELQYQAALISSHGHTTFHCPEKKMTAQLGDGAAIAAETKLPVVSDLRSLDLAFGGQGAPIVPIGEKLLLSGYDMFLNLGGIANISLPSFLGERQGHTVAFDVSPANRVLNMLVNDVGKEFDDEGKLAAQGKINFELLEHLNSLDYYQRSFPKSLANEFGIEVVYPLIKQKNISVDDALRTYVEHIVIQIRDSISKSQTRNPKSKILITGGGAFNKFLILRLTEELKPLNIEIVIPDESLIKFKEALIMAFMGVLRWRQENNVLSSVTGAIRDSIGGALWIGQEA